MIVIRDFSYSYPNGVNALKNINISVARGESVAVVGPNGAGKSTLLLCINGILRGAGRILVDGAELNDKNIYKIRETAGIVFQNPDDQLFNPTVYEDVAFGPKQMGFSVDEIDLRVKNSLSAVGMRGYENRESHHLSFGEKKKISLATALSMNSKTLLLDEPTSNLDPKGRKNFIDLLNSINMTKIIATHDLPMVMDVCTRVIILNKGRVTADGSAEELLFDDTLLDKNDLLFSSQLDRIEK